MEVRQFSQGHHIDIKSQSFGNNLKHSGSRGRSPDHESMLPYLHIISVGGGSEY
jgi:hypothetical protein